MAATEPPAGPGPEEIYAAALEEALEVTRINPRFYLERFTWKPRGVVWELTLRCNMRCAHCGSDAGRARPDELDREECLSLCDQLADLGCERLTLLGGEPFLHPNWEEIARRLVDRGVIVNAITNGWLFDAELVGRVRAAGLANLGVSIDGLRETHDRIRRMPGSFDRIRQGLDLCRDAGLPTAAVTTVTTENLGDLPGLHDHLVEHGVERWQIQVASPMGRLAADSPLVITPEQYADLVEFQAKIRRERRLLVDPADDIGYFGPCELALRATPGQFPPFWTGCQAGCQVLGVESNGTVRACLSLPPAGEFQEGTIRERPLADIWNDPARFAFNRYFQRAWMRGGCAACRYAAVCRGGCSSTAWCATGSVFDNPYCHLRVRGEHGCGRSGDPL